MTNPLVGSLGRRMAVLILFGAGLVLTLVIVFSHFAQRTRILANAVREGEALTQSIVYQIEAPLRSAQAVVQQVALVLDLNRPKRAETVTLIQRSLEAWPDLFGMAVALSESAASESDFQILYGFRDDGTIRVGDRASPLQDYQHDWFYLPYYLKAPVWIEPYYDADAQTLMVTYSVPVLREDHVVAVVTCDLSLAGIQKLLDEMPVVEDGMAILLSRRGAFLAHPEQAWIMRETIFSVADSLADPETARDLERLGRQMLSGEPGQMRYRRPFESGMAHMDYRSVPSTGWAFGVVRPEAAVLAPLIRLNQISALVAIVGLALLMVPAMGIAWAVATPLRHLADAAQRVATGDFGTALPPTRSRDEVGRLTAAFEQMRQDLQRYIADLTATTAARERIATELATAREIQMSIVPKIFPPFPDRLDIDLYAMLHPAFEVGGDLFDFALLDDDRLYLAIGDVSGKGVPASLLMAVGKTLLKSSVQNLGIPSHALNQVNRELAEGNESSMFITVFCSVLNLKTGELVYSSAGHNPPLLARREGDVQRLDDATGLILGIIPEAEYEDRHLRLNHGDLLLLYTDGITEAMDPNSVPFGDDRLLEFLQHAHQQPARTLLDELAASVRAHAGDAPQSDDLTSLAARFLAEPTGPVDGHIE